MRGMWLFGAMATAVLACQPSYTGCSPPGATSPSLPAAGPALAPLYTALLFAVKDLKPPPEPVGNGGGKLKTNFRGEDQFCCIDGAACLELSEFSIPFCYDKFTSNFRFYDGSDGILAQGTLNLVNGPKVDLIHGTYEGGGNIYGTNSPPNTATLPIPTLYTASGVGSAIPLTKLGGIATVTTTIPGTTVTGTTVPGSSYESVTVENGSTETMTTAVPGTTIPDVTIGPKTLIFTVTGASSATSSAAAPEKSHSMDMSAKIAWGLIAAVFA